MKRVNFSPVEHPSKLKRHGAVQVKENFFMMGGYDFICPGPGQIHNKRVHVTRNK